MAFIIALFIGFVIGFLACSIFSVNQLARLERRIIEIMGEKGDGHG
jgi:hypothetical protein